MKEWNFFSKVSLCSIKKFSGGSKGHSGRALGQISFFFMQFSAKTLPNNVFTAASRVGAPLGNPRSATALPYLKVCYLIFNVIQNVYNKIAEKL